MYSTVFYDVKGKYLKTLTQYVPIVARVHGSSHPEFYEVQNIFNQMVETMQNGGELTSLFAALREVTDYYRIPKNTCETYAAVYQMLQELDEAYQK